MDLPTTKDDQGSGSFHLNAGSNHTSTSQSRKGTSSDHTRATSATMVSYGSATHNEAWEDPPKTRIKLLEELKNEPTMTREDLKQCAGGANLDDIIDMVYKIRLSYEFDWEKLLEEDIEEESDHDVAMETMMTSSESKDPAHPAVQIRRESNHLPEPTATRRPRKRPSVETRAKPSLHLHRQRENRPAFGPGILIS